MNLENLYNEAEEYSNYEGDLGYESRDLESGYFVQDGEQNCNQHTVNPLDRTLTYKIVSTGTTGTAAAVTDQVTIFGANRGVTGVAGTTGTGSNITVTLEESSFSEMNEEIKGNPVVVQGARFFVANSLQFNNVWTVVKRQPTGKQVQYTWQPNNYISPTNFRSDLLDAPDFGMVVDGRTYIEFLCGRFATPNEHTLVLTVKARSSNVMQLFGQSPKQLATAIRPTGNPVADEINKPLLGM